MVKVLVISDTHNLHESMTLPEADMIIHCGDATLRSELVEFFNFTEWFKSLPYKHKIFVPGNHDSYGINVGYYIIKEMFGTSVQMLLTDYIEIEGLKIFGSVQNGYQICPENVDILITHEPPSCILDEVPAFSQFNSDPHPMYLGNTLLLTEIIDRIKPRYHMFGHIHECGGQYKSYKNTLFINAAVLDENYTMVRPQGMLININPL
jgi:predicted phosphodiesterase